MQSLLKRYTPPMSQPKFLQKPLDQMSPEEWESICDGCGLCCQITLQDEDTNELTQTNAACRYLCLNSHRCTDYANRQVNVPSCVRLTPQNIHDLDWAPQSCSYRRVAAGQPLAAWHHLLCGDREEVHRTGPSMKGELICEDDVEWDY